MLERFSQNGQNIGSSLRNREISHVWEKYIWSIYFPFFLIYQEFEIQILLQNVKKTNFIPWFHKFLAQGCLCSGVLYCYEIMTKTRNRKESKTCIYRKKSQKFGHLKNCGNYPKNWTMWLCHRVMSPKNADRMANSVDPDQTAVWFGSTLFAQANLAENLGSLR